MWLKFLSICFIAFFSNNFHFNSYDKFQHFAEHFSKLTANSSHVSAHPHKCTVLSERPSRTFVYIYFILFYFFSICLHFACLHTHFRRNTRTRRDVVNRGSLAYWMWPMCAYQIRFIPFGMRRWATAKQQKQQQHFKI